MLSIDYSFNYKNLSRFIFIHNLFFLNNIFNIPRINKLIFVFFLNQIGDLDDVSIYNYFFFFKFFFGYRAFFTGFKTRFHLGSLTYSLNVRIILMKKDLYYSMLFFSNDIVNISKQFSFY